MTAPAPGPPSCHCVTCADEGTPMRVVEIEPGRGLARCVEEGGAVSTTVETALVEPVAPGERVLVHAGVALVRLDGGDPPPPAAWPALRSAGEGTP